MAQAQDSQQLTRSLRDQISQAVADQLLRDSPMLDWAALTQLDKPVLRIHFTLQDDAPRHRGTPARLTPHLEHVVDLSHLASRPTTPASPPDPDPLGLGRGTKRKRRTSAQQQLESSPVQPPSTRPQASQDSPTALESARPLSSSPDTDDESLGTQQRRAISGLRPAHALVETESHSQRQIHSEDKFPKRRAHQPERHLLRPSTLDKLIQGIWEQIHGSLAFIPESLLESLPSTRSTQEVGLVHHKTQLSLACVATPQPTPDQAALASGPVGESTSRTFKQSNAFCSQVTRASRTCRSLEVIVQARWVEQFDAYVDSMSAADPTRARTRFNKAALVEACTDFGWSEKELRNKMAIWRGYHEIKEAGGWAALVFAGMGIYRFCKYRVGFDKDSMQRLRDVRPAVEVAADTLHPNWRKLLSAVGEPSEPIYPGHPHDYVMYLDGTAPVPLDRTYLQWDPHFAYQQIDECIVDERAWAGDDPRWAHPSPNDPSALYTCDNCGKEQSDDPKRNDCSCFPSLFGTTQPLPAPVMVFRTSNGRNNGLMALCPFDRGVLVGEFVGLVTKGLSDVDVMESTSANGTSYQIWQGRHGNFTRFVNHSCKANAQYQRFSWLGTQHVILVSKGIEAGEEITVDYSDKYWKGLDKKCLCGHSCCRYRGG